MNTYGRTIDISALTDEEQDAFIAGYERAGGYMDDVESPYPCCCPWLFLKEIRVVGESPEEWGAEWWEDIREDVEERLREAVSIESNIEYV